MGSSRLMAYIIYARVELLLKLCPMTRKQPTLALFPQGLIDKDPHHLFTPFFICIKTALGIYTLQHGDQ